MHLHRVIAIRLDEVRNAVTLLFLYLLIFTDEILPKKRFENPASSLRRMFIQRNRPKNHRKCRVDSFSACRKKKRAFFFSVIGPKGI